MIDLLFCIILRTFSIKFGSQLNLTNLNSSNSLFMYATYTYCDPFFFLF